MTIDRDTTADGSRSPAFLAIRSVAAIVLAGLAILVVLPAALAASAT